MLPASESKASKLHALQGETRNDQVLDVGRQWRKEKEMRDAERREAGPRSTDVVPHHVLSLHLYLIMCKTAHNGTFVPFVSLSFHSGAMTILRRRPVNQAQGDLKEVSLA